MLSSVCLCSLVQFHPDISRLQLFSSSVDCGIRLWDLRSSQCVCVLDSHYSAVTSLSFSKDGDTMIRYGEISQHLRSLFLLHNCFSDVALICLYVLLVVLGGIKSVLFGTSNLARLKELFLFTR